MISVALAAYNGAKYIREQLDSILAQTCQDFEIVVCDDCSRDRTFQILQEYARKDSRIKIFRNQQNLGFKKNFEKAVSLCSGDYIALSDQDDVWTENHLELLLNNLGGKSVSAGNAVLTNRFGITHHHRLLNEAERFYFFHSGKFIYRVFFSSASIQGASMLMPAGFAKKCLPIPDKIRFHDAFFIACACLENGVSYSFEVINNYRQHGGNITYFSHNKIRMKFVKRLKYRLKYWRRRFGKGFVTDRFCYVETLKERYGLKNPDFEFIYNVYEKAKRHKLFSFREIKLLWQNFYYIMTAKTHKGFLRFLFNLQFRLREN